MTNRFLGIGFVLATSLGFGNLAFAQVDNIGDPLRGSRGRQPASECICARLASNHRM